MSKPSWSFTLRPLPEFLILLASFFVVQPYGKCCQSSENAVVEKNLDPENFVIGQVVDDRGMPIPNASAYLLCWTPDQKPSTATTDKSGLFRLAIDKVRPSTYPLSKPDLFLWVYAKGHNIRCVRPLFSPDGENRCIVRLDPEDDVTVQVMAPDGSAAEGAVVEPNHYAVPNGLYDSDLMTGLFHVIPGELSQELAAEVDDEGNAKLRGISRHFLRSVFVDSDGNAKQNFHFSTGSELNVRLMPTGSVSGRLADSNGKPLEGIQVTVASNSKEDVSSWIRTQTDATGAFDAVGIIAGQLKIYLDWDRKQPFVLKPVPSKSVQENETTEIEIEFTRGVEFTGQVLTEDTREPISGAFISFRERPDTVELVCPIQTDATGTYQGFAAPGPITIGAYDSGSLSIMSRYSYPQTRQEVIAPNVDKVNFEPLLFIPRKALSAHLDDRRGNPIVNRSVAFISKNRGHLRNQAKTDDKGDLIFYLDQYEYENYSQPDYSWVLLPDGYVQGTVDLRTLPVLEIESYTPLVLSSDE